MFTWLAPFFIAASVAAVSYTIYTGIEEEDLDKDEVIAYSLYVVIGILALATYGGV